ncbi:thioredoxin-like protein [Schizothecium vesticola]|uniref:Large ribosomal subunit protein mL43 n=1 Tax=Schizothecium vesticola TaxID=314040 RepID=A0AA40BQ46_9PEZI|nr:thioredoxin-like protein [Schizothecium vesticola]
MTVLPIQRVSTGRNGVGAFILQCKKMDFHFCDWAGSSKGMNTFLKSFLPAFAQAHPQIEMTVSPRPGKHPVIIGHYINGKQQSFCVKNIDPSQVLQKAKLLRDASGEKPKKYSKPVSSINESVRGVWSPYHGNGLQV